jgi:NAD(P)-dependent dehydrogenase (short-subunit alcohol dehydrogenase family)
LLGLAQRCRSGLYLCAGRWADAQHRPSWFASRIRANLVYPGLVDTPNGRSAGADRPSRGKARVPFGRQATAWEIACAVLFFLSDESVYITAQTLAVDSGLSGM